MQKNTLRNDHQEMPPKGTANAPQKRTTRTKNMHQKTNQITHPTRFCAYLFVMFVRFLICAMVFACVFFMFFVMCFFFCVFPRKRTKNNTANRTQTHAKAKTRTFLIAFVVTVSLNLCVHFCGICCDCFFCICLVDPDKCGVFAFGLHFCLHSDVSLGDLVFAFSVVV